MTERKKWYSSSFVFENKRTYAKNDGKQVLLLLATGNSINVPRKPRTAKPWMQDGFITNESRNSLALPSVVIGIMVFWVSKRPSNHLPRGWSDDPRGIEPLHLIDSSTLKRIRLEGRSFQSPQRSSDFKNEYQQQHSRLSSSKFNSNINNLPS